MNPLPRVLLVDPAARDRLQVVAALHGVADVHTPEPNDHPVRLVRHDRFDVVLVALPRLAARRGLGLVRTLKTDGGRPPPVGVLDPWRRLRDVPGAIEESLADGYLGGTVDTDVLVDFLSKLRSGGRPVVTRESPDRSLWGRLRGGF
jgi:hypothetical protein